MNYSLYKQAAKLIKLAAMPRAKTGPTIFDSVEQNDNLADGIRTVLENIQAATTNPAPGPVQSTNPVEDPNNPQNRMYNELADNEYVPTYSDAHIPEDTIDKPDTIWNKVKNTTGRVAHGVLHTMPFLFIDNKPSAEESMRMVNGAITKNKELAQAARNGGWRTPKWLGSVAGRTVGGFGMPLLGGLLTPAAIEYHIDQANEDSSKLGKTVNYGQAVLDGLLGATDAAYIGSQIPGIARIPRIGWLASKGFRWTGPAVGYSTLWDLLNAYRKRQEKEMESAVARQERRNEAANDMAELQGRFIRRSANAIDNLATNRSYIKQHPEDKQKQEKLQQKQRDIATNYMITMSQMARAKTDPNVTGNPNPGIVPTGQPIEIDMSKERPVPKNSSFKKAPTPPPTPRIPLMFAPPSSTGYNQWEVGKNNYNTRINSSPTIWKDEKGVEHTGDPEYYENLNRQIRTDSPRDYISWWARPFLGEQIGDDRSSEMTQSPEFQEQTDQNRKSFWKALVDGFGRSSATMTMTPR